MTGEEQQFVREAFESNWLSGVGPNVDAFERETAAVLGSGVRCLAVSSGTAALHLVLRSVGVTAGDRVAVSTATFIGSVYPVLYLGAEPVFIDSEETSGNMDAAMLDECLSVATVDDVRPKAVVAVHLYGQHADVDALKQVADHHGVILVEDAAESLGSTYRGRQTATTADYSILSFNGNKIITTTGGGMAVAKSDSAIMRMRKWANQAREPGAAYHHTELGYNYRTTNVLAGIGRGQLRVLSARVAARRAIAERYARLLGDVPGISLQPEASWGTHTRWLSIVFLDREVYELDPLAITAEMEQQNIEARPLWKPMHMQPIFEGFRSYGGRVAERQFACGLCLPSSSSLTPSDQDRVVEALCQALRRRIR